MRSSAQEKVSFFFEKTTFSWPRMTYFGILEHFFRTLCASRLGEASGVALVAGMTVGGDNRKLIFLEHFCRNNNREVTNHGKSLT